MNKETEYKFITFLFSIIPITIIIGQAVSLINIFLISIYIIIEIVRSKKLDGDRRARPSTRAPFCGLGEAAHSGPRCGAAAASRASLRLRARGMCCRTTGGGSEATIRGRGQRSS